MFGETNPRHTIHDRTKDCRLTRNVLLIQIPQKKTLILIACRLQHRRKIFRLTQRDTWSSTHHKLAVPDQQPVFYVLFIPPRRRVQATLCHVCRRNEKENIFSKVKDVWARPAITAGLYIAQERLGVMPAGTRCRKAARKGGRRPRRVVVGQTPETRRTERRDWEEVKLRERATENKMNWNSLFPVPNGEGQVP